MGRLPTFCIREVPIGTLALGKAMYGVELADVGPRLKLAAVRLLRGPTRTFQAKEVPKVVLAPVHRVSPV